MDNNEIDASLGLAFSLELFKRYKRSGVFYAEVWRIPNLQGKAIAFLYLINGVTTSSYIEDLNGKRYPVSENDLIQIDRDKGPFAWSLKVAFDQPFLPQTQQVSEIRPDSQKAEPVASRLADTTVPVIIAPIGQEQFSSWTAQQQQVLYTIWHAIDGKRSVKDIKAITSATIPAMAVEEALLVLLKLKIVAMIQ